MKSIKARLLNPGNTIFLIILGIIMIVPLSSCEKDDNDLSKEEELPNIVETAKGVEELSTLVTAIETSNLDAALSDDGPYTVFAPVNSAFANLDQDQLNNILSNTALLQSLLKYHVVSGEIYSNQLTNGKVSTLLEGQELDIDLSNEQVTINGNSKVIQADIKTSNGVVHLVDQVLMPENLSPATPTIAGIAVADKNFSSLVSILSRPALSDLLAAASDSGADLTVFAPTDAAFNELISILGLNNIDDLSDALLADVVRYHIVSGSYYSTDLESGELTTLLAGESLNLSLENGVMVNDANVTMADIGASNGVIHVVDKVLLPKFITDALGTVAEATIKDKNYSTLYSALRKADLFNAITSAENITVFAPDNNAFNAAGITSLDNIDDQTLSSVLLYHVLGAKVMSSNLPSSAMAETLNGESIYFGYLSNKVLINGLTSITGVDLEFSNGVIHTIDKTLMPPANDVVDIAAAMADMGDESEFTVLVSLLVADEYSDILNALRSSDDITVFAPTDDAFSEISEIIPTLSTDQIASVLKYHVLGTRVFSTDLKDGLNVSTLNGQTITVYLSNGAQIMDLSGGDYANITEVNINGKNGVIHVIDKVLIPEL